MIAQILKTITKIQFIFDNFKIKNSNDLNLKIKFNPQEHHFNYLLL